MGRMGARVEGLTAAESWCYRVLSLEKEPVAEGGGGKGRRTELLDVLEEGEMGD